MLRDNLNLLSTLTHDSLYQQGHYLITTVHTIKTLVQHLCDPSPHPYKQEIVFLLSFPPIPQRKTANRQPSKRQDIGLHFTQGCTIKVLKI